MKHWRSWAVALAVLWIAAVTVWALNPITVTVRTGVNADGSEKTATVECDSPLSGNTSPTSSLPVIGPGESFGEEPCHDAVTSGRIIYFIDVAIAVGILIFLVASRGRFDERPEGTIAHDASASA